MTSQEIKDQIDLDIVNATDPGSVSTDDVGGNMKSIVDYVDQEIEAIAPAIKEYVALISQDAGDAPSVVILKNTLGETLNWTRDAVGTYSAVASTEIFGNRKSSYVIGQPLYGTVGIDVFLDTVTVKSHGATGADEDDILSHCTIEIKVYP